MPLLFDPRGIPAKPITATLVLTSGDATRKVAISQQGRARLERPSIRGMSTRGRAPKVV
ncbi:hypothetical protein [Thermus thermophilus]|uniref:hypothetical protein n=1 Tax=Thermus thermophilus TaxID=274 RepID=UPI001CC385E8